MAATNQPTDIASEAQNDKLKHSQGGITTRDDVLDLGVPMLPGDPSERVGPEDALGESPTRGDYRDRLGNVRPRTSAPILDAKPGEPQVRMVDQTQNAEVIGDLKGKKGGVDPA